MTATGPDSDETLLGGRVRHRPAAGLKPTTDTVLLAAAVAAGPGERVLDAGCGSGAASLCLAVRCSGCAIVALERNRDLARAAAANVELNGLRSRIGVEQGDLASFCPKGPGFGIVMTNPPHLEPGRSRRPADPVRGDAMVESMSLKDWIGHCSRVLEPGGSLVVLHRAERRDDVLKALGSDFGSIDVFPLWPRATGAPAKRILVRATRGSRMPMRMLEGLVLHDPDGGYTGQAERILRGGAPLRWS